MSEIRQLTLQGLYATRVEGARTATGIGLGYSYRPGTQGVHPSGLALGLGRRF
ncbi:hypothetical protein [Armatimonas sp.]|uniref:hypothetical protein n=1 Tax=Armatimonas sp. TaxID=1872638 RepID=UPI00286C4871|nr:hypothetical protein [Armatimonas sp.]